MTGWASAAAEPRVIRTFEDTPREEAEAGVAFSWTTNRFTVNLSATYANDPIDEEELRPDDTYLGMVLGNWMVTVVPLPGLLWMSIWPRCILTIP